MRVLIWATHLQTDILALTLHLDACPDVELLVVARNAAAYLRSPIARARPLRAPVLDRDGRDTAAAVRAFNADVAVADNHIPPPGSAPRLAYMWHGMGWKARSKVDLQIFYHQVERLTGIDPRQPNPRFFAQCYGPDDYRWRIENWGLAAENCAMLGMSFIDLIRNPPYAPADLAADYKIDINNRKTVLFSLTWHYGGVFSRQASVWETLRSLFGGQRSHRRDMAFLQRLAETVRARGANLLICMHDRHRYDPLLVRAVEALAAAHDFIEVRFKDDYPDNLSDLLVADVMLSNLSSFITYFYQQGRPVIHVMPAPDGAVRFERMVMLASRIRFRGWARVENAWMMDPFDVAGPVVHTAEDAARAVEHALDHPASYRATIQNWVAAKIHAPSTSAAARFKMALDRLCATPLAAAGRNAPALPPAVAAANQNEALQVIDKTGRTH